MSSKKNHDLAKVLKDLRTSGSTINFEGPKMVDLSDLVFELDDLVGGEKPEKVLTDAQRVRVEKASTVLSEVVVQVTAVFDDLLALLDEIDPLPPEEVDDRC